MVIHGIRRVLLSLAEVSVLVAGFFLALVFANVVDMIREDAAWFAFWVGLLATFAGFVLLVRRNAVRRMEYDAAAYVIEKAERRARPRLARWKRVVKRAALWVPIAIAAFALLYFPQATHVLHPWATHLTHYRVPVPWNFIVLPASYSGNAVWAYGTTGKHGRLGVTGFWDVTPMSSYMDFGWIEPSAYGFKLEYANWPRAAPPGVTARYFPLGDATLICWEHASRGGPEYAIVRCKTPPEAADHNLYADFSGRNEDVAAFYKILQGVRPWQFSK